MARRVRWWEEREATLARELPTLLDETPRRAEAHGIAETYLPVATLRDEVHGALTAWFGEALAELDVRLDAGALGRARSWLEARDWVPQAAAAGVPSRWIRALQDRQTAHDLCFELFASPVLGARVGRYADHTATIADAVSGTGPLRVWDAGCGTGEGTWELALALAARGRPVDALGTTPWPLERLMAERRERPGNPAAGEALAALLDASPEGTSQCTVRFLRGDLLGEPPAGTWDVVACHGVLGGLLAGADAVCALELLAAGLTPGGVLSVTDCFREDRRQETEALLAREAPRLGLEPLGPPGLLRRSALA